MLKKLKLILNEMKLLIGKHKLYFLAPLVISLAVVAFLFIKLGAGVIMTFIYAGV